MQFLYFTSQITEPNRLDPAAIERLGLGGVVDGCGLTVAGCNRGPDGRPGVVFYAGPATRLMAGYRPAEQDWVERAGDAWVGVQRDNPPTESSLRRRRFLAGEPVELGAAFGPPAAWTIPIARSLVRGTTLPRRPCLGADRTSWRLEELPEFVSLCGAAEEVFAALDPAHGTFRLEALRLIEIAALALSANYRVGAVEIELLRVFDTTDRCWAVAQAIVDLPEYLRNRAAAETAEGAEEKKPPAPLPAAPAVAAGPAEGVPADVRGPALAG